MTQIPERLFYSYYVLLIEQQENIDIDAFVFKQLQTKMGWRDGSVDKSVCSASTKT